MNILRPALFVTGLFLVGLALVMWIPIGYMLAVGEAEAPDFLLSSGITLAVGLVVALASRRHGGFALVPRQVFVLTTLSWIGVVLFAALPMVFIQHISYTDAFFETMSGVTTTGSTVLIDLDYAPRGILLWRALLQWAGGIGFIVMGVLILPFLRVGGMRLFHAESSDRSEKVLPRFESVAKAISLAYLLLSLVCALAYWLAGMSIFDAITHAMTTLSTGGYSNYDASIGYFQKQSILWIAVVFMLLGSLPFSLYVHALRGRFAPLWRDRQVRGFLGVVLFFGLLLTLVNVQGQGRAIDSALVVSFFSVVSVVTTTGYVAEDYGLWGGLGVMVFFYLMFVGGCSGSTAGGLKIFRLQVAYILLRQQLRRLVHPHAIFTERYNDREIGEDILRSLISFSFFFAITIGLLALALSAVGLDFMTSLTGAATAVTNIGPGLGAIVGPTGNFASLPDSAKWLLGTGMLLGRLEIMTVLVLLTPAFWRG
ncbi:MAG: TrkH family potassium uptake protein [Gammaproteobacteria bacterium]|nr:TrkH family potassium uptake protein [Gammaproteobacteria bacterium]